MNPILATAPVRVEHRDRYRVTADHRTVHRYRLAHGTHGWQVLHTDHMDLTATPTAWPTGSEDTYLNAYLTYNPDNTAPAYTTSDEAIDAYLLAEEAATLTERDTIHTIHCAA